MSQRGETRADGIERLFGEREVTAFAVELALEHEIEQPLEIGLRLARQANLEAHLRVFAARLRAVSSLRCSVPTTASAATYSPVR